ncbi:MAG TPA: alginate export family protein [Chryseosolibacter sp.]|nr:alginate export family protein [Chryseosolibacter sp.]
MKVTCRTSAKYLTSILLFIQFHAYSQLDLSGQLRTRTEYRQGQGTLLAKDAEPAFFTSQRSRLGIGYSGSRFRLYTAVQDVRVWGQDASTINRTTPDARNGLMMHEAWADISLLDTALWKGRMTLKIGRQELVYDDSRLLGNLDWLQQARRHDMALLRFVYKNWRADTGAAFNQNSESTKETKYNGVPTSGTYPAGTNGIGSMYKSLQFLHVRKMLSKGFFSILLIKDDFNRFYFDTTSRVLDEGVWSRITTGINCTSSVAGKMSVLGSAFLQSGENKNGDDLSAWMLTINASYKWATNLSTTIGSDWTSGNDNTTATVDRRFDPLYGTPHKFWGYMDYFYVSSPFGTSGLKDYYIKLQIKARGGVTFNLDTHQFYTANVIKNDDGSQLKSRLGTEIDLITSYPLTKEIGIEAGYCLMFATRTMSSIYVKNVANADHQANWAYVMVTVKSEYFRSSK